MPRTTTPRTLAVTPRMEEAWQAVDACFGRFCLTAGIEALHAMMAADVEDLCGRRHARSPERRGHRWGRTRGKIGYQGGKVDIVRPRVRGGDGEELAIAELVSGGNRGLARHDGHEPDADRGGHPQDWPCRPATGRTTPARRW